jgi:hypothetical protein
MQLKNEKNFECNLEIHFYVFFKRVLGRGKFSFLVVRRVRRKIEASKIDYREKFVNLCKRSITIFSITNYLFVYYLVVLTTLCHTLRDFFYIYRVRHLPHIKIRFATCFIDSLRKISDAPFSESFVEEKFCFLWFL